MASKEINTILINFPTNLGDVILGLPVLDKIRVNYPKSTITAIVSPGVKDFMLRNGYIDNVVVFNKHWRLREKLRFALSLRGKYDLMVDLKNSFLPVLLGARYRTPFIRFFPKNKHIKDKYLALITKFGNKKGKKGEFSLSSQERDVWEGLNLGTCLFVACTSLSPIKTYSYKYLKRVISDLGNKYKVVVVGLEKDREFYKNILSMKNVVDLVGKTTMVDVFYLLKKHAHLFLGVDSSILHAAGYLNIPIVALFGPTHPRRSYPYSQKVKVLRKDALECVPCEKAECNLNSECMKIEPEQVVKVIKKIW